MHKTKHVLIDGQVLDDKSHKHLFEVFYQQKINIFKLYTNKLILNYVGYIEININGRVYELYCFPKEYNYAYSEINTDVQYNQIKSDFRNVIKTILKASKSLRSQGHTLDFESYTSNIYYLEQIINHYQKYGNIVEVDQDYKRTNNGKINWNKTIGKVTSKYINKQFIYDEFIVEKKNVNITFLTKLISKILCEDTVKYDFILPVIDTGIDYTDILELSNEQCIDLLLGLRNKTFKDYLHNVIDNLIAYIQNDTNKVSNGTILGTNNFELIWEELVAYGLGEKYKHSVVYEVSSTESSNKRTIKLDHLNLEEKIIVDSKYYVHTDEEGYEALFDYKQLYYNYYLVYDTFIKEKSRLISPEEMTKEYRSWTNVLIRPGRNEHGLKDQDKCKIIFKDGLELLTLYYDIKDIINDYANDIPNYNIKTDLEYYRKSNKI